MRSWTKWATFLSILAVFLLLPSQAEGAGLVVYHYGENVKEIGEVTEEHQESIRTELGGPAQVGFIHNAFGLFWLDIWTWDGRFCLYRGEQYWEIDAEQAAVFLDAEARQNLALMVNTIVAHQQEGAEAQG